MNAKRHYIWTVLLIVLSVQLYPQSSGPSYYRSSVHNANRVKTVFGNWGVIGQPVDTRPRGAWIYSSNGYLGDVSILVAADVKVGSKQFKTVIGTPVARPASIHDYAPDGISRWTFMPVDGYFNPLRQSIAMSDDKNTWPTQWPDKMGDAIDPGWQGSWNGYFGKRISANQESFYVMDDNNDQRFNFAEFNPDSIAFKPDSTNINRSGLGLEVKVRGLQWTQFLAQDNIFFLYEIENKSTSNYDRVAFGMLVGTLVGVTGTQFFTEADDDWSFYSVNENITYTGDIPGMQNPFWQGPVGLVGYAFLESPGNPYDGIDNDGDVPKYHLNPTTQLFKATDFDSTQIFPGQNLVLVANDFSRTNVSMPNSPTTFTTRGGTVSITPGVTKLVEGNRILILGDTVVNPNAYDGIDNDLDGVIDENFSLHYRQIKVDPVSKKYLINILRPVHHADYSPAFTGGPLSMVDERRDDGVDNDNDWDVRYDDVGADGLSGTGDTGEKNSIPSSGEPNFDQTDINESDQIGLTSFYYFAPSRDVPLGNDAEMWKLMQPGTFSVPSNIENNVPVGGADGDFIYASGYFPLLSKKTERFSLALVYGGGIGGSVQDNINDLVKHKQTVQKIYDANYQFAIAPEPVPTITAVAEDGKVLLYWDRKSEDAIDPVFKIKDFQGYKIYKATDYEFNDAYSVTDANGIRKGFKPTFQFDLKDTIDGYYRAPESVFNDAAGFTYFLGKNTGLQHDTVDTDVMNGKTYYYVIVAYDAGNDSSGIFPSENGWKIDIDQAGRVRGASQNVAIVTPGKKAAGYTAPPSSTKLTAQPGVTGNGNVYFNVIDGSKITGNTYEIAFSDTRDSNKLSPVTTSYTVRDTTWYTGTFTPGKVDNIAARLPRTNLVPGTVTIYKLDGSLVDTSKYSIHYERGTIQAKNRYYLQADTNNLKRYTIKYQYYPVYRSPYINGSPFVNETYDTDIFDGVQLHFENKWPELTGKINLIDSLTKWNTGTKAYGFQFSTIDQDVDGNGANEIATAYAADYDIHFSNTVIDSTTGIYGFPKIPINFSVRNITDNKRVEIYWNDNLGVGQLSNTDQFLFFERDAKDSLRYTWTITFLNPTWWQDNTKDTILSFVSGDSLKIRTMKSFRKGDVFMFKTEKPKIVTSSIPPSLSNIRVVPNPYVVQATWETPPAAGTFGRGERKIEFQNLPQDAKVSIYTSRGEHIRTLYQDGTIQNGTVKWDVKTKENLDVAFGVYFYVVESTAGTKTGKIAVIK